MTKKEKSATKYDLDGFDPLTSTIVLQQYSESFFEEATKREISNILKFYTGFYGIFSESIQNSLDALAARQSLEDEYQPKLWIKIDIPGSQIKVVDNGIGMNREEFQFFLKPNVSFKDPGKLRGHKGVGATFLAYGYTLFFAQSKKLDSQFSVALRGGRDWAEDVGGITPRPKFEAREFSSAELSSEYSGTSIEIVIGNHPSERPRDLGWIGARNANQWLDVLRLKTPLGGVYLTTGEMQCRS